MTTTYSLKDDKLWELFPEFQFPKRDSIYYIKDLRALAKEYLLVPLTVKQDIRDTLLKELDIRIKEIDEWINKALEELHGDDCDFIMKVLNTDLPRRVQDLEPVEQRKVVLEWLDNMYSGKEN